MFFYGRINYFQIEKVFWHFYDHFFKTLNEKNSVYLLCWLSLALVNLWLFFLFGVFSAGVEDDCGSERSFFGEDDLRLPFGTLAIYIISAENRKCIWFSLFNLASVDFQNYHRLRCVDIPDLRFLVFIHIIRAFFLKLYIFFNSLSNHVVNCQVLILIINITSYLRKTN